MTRQRLLPRALLAGAACALLAPLSLADTIRKIDGTAIQGVTIESEKLAGVSYKGKGASETIAIDQVAAVEYDRRPKPIDEAAVQAVDGNREGAFITLKDYVAAQLDNPSDERRYPWAAAFAARRAIELAQERQAWGDLIAMADTLIGSFPDSRHVPFAYLAKADAQALQGKRDDAERTLTQFASLVESKGLPQSYALSARLTKATVSATLKPEVRLTELEAVSKAAEGNFPAVFVDSLVARGETYLQIGFDDKARRGEMIDKARVLFERASSAPAASRRTVAAAMTGLAECLYLGANPETDKDAIRRARELYLRVGVLYPEQTQYAARALFTAGRCFDLLDEEQSKQRAQRLYREVRQRYPDTVWAENARNQRR